MLVRARHDLIGHRIAVHNQLLAVMQHNLPGAIGLFSQLDIPISLAFLRRFPITHVELPTTLRAQQGDLEARFKESLLAHPDGPIFQSLPRTGTVRAATLLAEIATAAPGSPTHSPWPPRPGSHRRPESPGSS